MSVPTTVRLVLPGGREVTAGTLHHASRGQDQTPVFTYATSYLADPQAYPLGPDLPVTTGPHVPGVGGDFGAFSDSAPDRWGQGLLRRAELAAAREEGRTPRTLLPADFLLGTMDELRQGALRFVDADGIYRAQATSGVPRLVDLPHLLALTDRAVADPSLDADLRDLIAAGSSLGGARPKAAVRDNRRTLRIAKLPRRGSDEWDVMAWEGLTLDLAQAAGIQAARHEVVTVAGRTVLLVDRFDRDGGSRRGYASAMSLLGASDRTGDVSFAELAEETMATSARPLLDGRELFRRAAFGALVSNTDNHLRNHGFLRTDRGWALSPAFDLNPDPDNSPPAMPLVPGGGTVVDLVDWSPSFGLTEAQALVVLGEIDAAVDGWKHRAALARIDPREIALMVPAFDNSARREAKAILAAAAAAAGAGLAASRPWPTPSPGADPAPGAGPS